MTPDDPLYKALQALPREIEPARDLWADIAPQLAPAPAANRQPPWWWGLAAAAAILAVAVGAGQLMPEPAAVETVAVAEADWSSQLADGMATLEAALAAQQDEMDPELWLIVDQSLGEMDDAIGRVEAAMAQKPDDPRLEDALARLRRQRVALLRTAVNL